MIPQSRERKEPPTEEDEEESVESTAVLYTPATHGSLRVAVGSVLGVLIHAVADGIALGTSVESADKSLHVVVILAIVVHKAPTSIGTCTLLMARQLPRRDIEYAVGLFSAAAPLSALVTYGVIQGFAQLFGSGGTVSSRQIGAVLSFSGGTFLYFAIHAVLELAAHEPLGVSDACATENTLNLPHQHHPHDRDHPIHARVTRASAWQVPCFSRLTRWIHVPESMHTTWSFALVVFGSITPRLLQLLLGDHHD